MATSAMEVKLLETEVEGGNEHMLMRRQEEKEAALEEMGVQWAMFESSPLAARQHLWGSRWCCV